MLKDPADQVNKNFFVFATDIFCEFLCFNLSSLDGSDLNNQYPGHGLVCYFLICKGIQLHFNCFGPFAVFCALPLSLEDLSPKQIFWPLAFAFDFDECSIQFFAFAFE